MDKTEIIERIGYIRVKGKLTQKALSVAIGMNPAYINRLESKKDFLPSLDVLMKIIEECGSTPEEFFYHNISEYDRDKELIQTLKDLPEDIKSFILNYDPEIMHLFTRLNEKAVKLSEKDKKKV